jgi:hypothetical protein
MFLAVATLPVPGRSLAKRSALDTPAARELRFGCEADYHGIQCNAFHEHYYKHEIIIEINIESKYHSLHVHGIFIK